MLRRYHTMHLYRVHGCVMMTEHANVRLVVTYQWRPRELHPLQHQWQFYSHTADPATPLQPSAWIWVSFWTQIWEYGCIWEYTRTGILVIFLYKLSGQILQKFSRLGAGIPLGIHESNFYFINLCIKPCVGVLAAVCKKRNGQHMCLIPCYPLGLIVDGRWVHQDR